MLSPHGIARRRVRGAMALCALGVTLTACARDAAPEPGVTRADSAGVRIITSGAEDRELAWTFERIDVLRDSVGEPWLFDRFMRHHLITDRAGRTYVLLTQDGQVARFGRDGRFERMIGRRGGGPGEMQFPIALGQQGDSLFVRDIGKRTLVRFGPTFDPIPELRLEGALAESGWLAFRTGGFWFETSPQTDSTQGEAVWADTLGTAPLKQVSTRVGAPVDFGCIGLPRPTPLFSPSLSVAASGPRMVIGMQPEYEIWLYEGSRAITSLRRPLALRAPTEADVRVRYPEGMRIGIPGRPGCQVSVEDLIARQGLAPALPFVWDVQLLSDGTIWALRSQPLDRTQIVDVFGASGAYAGTARGRRLPVGRLPNGELLFPEDDEDSGGIVIARVRVGMQP
jgi:hypothetical protein